jgi:hypothetical protein
MDRVARARHTTTPWRTALRDSSDLPGASFERAREVPHIVNCSAALSNAHEGILRSDVRCLLLDESREKAQKSECCAAEPRLTGTDAYHVARLSMGCIMITLRIHRASVYRPYRAERKRCVRALPHRIFEFAGYLAGGQLRRVNSEFDP